MRRMLLAWCACSVACSVAGCGAAECRNEVLRGLPSPDGTVIAFVFRRTCAGAAATQVSVIELNRALKGDSGNVLELGSEQPVKVIWEAPGKLLVSNFQEPVLRRAARVGEVTIQFR